MKLRVVYLILISLFGSVTDGVSQNIENGFYHVGFNYFKLHDESRKYIVNNDTISRPLLMHFWFPSEENTVDSSCNFKNYIDLISMRENFNKPSAEIDGYSYNFINAYAGFAKSNLGIDTNLTTQQILDYPVVAKYGIDIAKPTKKFPLIIYAPSNSKSSVQNHIICEYLASHGFMVISVGSAGGESLIRKNDQISILAQVTDMEYILNYFDDSLKINYSGLGLFGYSTGGLATTIFQMRNEEVGAIFSMDGSQEFGHYTVLSKVDDFDLNETRVPYCLVTNNYDDFSIYPYYNSIVTNDKYMFRMPYLDHNGFVSFWKFFDLCSSSLTLNKFCTSYDYICSTSVIFFNTYLKNPRVSKKKSGMNIETNEYIEYVTNDNSLIAQLGNLLLEYNIDSVNYFLVENQENLRTKENEIIILSKLIMDNNIEASQHILLFNEKLHPDSWQTLFQLGQTYNIAGEMALAKETLLKAQKLNPDNTEINNLLNKIDESDK